MTSGCTFAPSFFTRHAASKIARACIAVISGYTIPKPAAAMAEHRVGFFELLDPAFHRFHGGVGHVRQLVGEFGLFVQMMLREELVQRRIQQANRHRPIAHRPEQRGEVVPLERQQLRQGLRAGFFRFRENHFANLFQMAEEHVLGPAQPHALGSQVHRDLGIGGFGVGPHVAACGACPPIP